MAAGNGLDELNLNIVRILQIAPRTTNKDIAERLGVAEATVAARIRSLEERRLLRVMMQRDFQAMGLELMALIDIRVERRRPEDVASDLAQIEEAASVSVTMSSPEVILQLQARDGLHLLKLIEDQVAPVKGIAGYEIMTALQVVKLDARYGALEATA